MVERSRAMCTGVESALAALLLPALVKAQLAILNQEYMKLLMKHPMLGGDDHTSCPSQAVDAENNGGDKDDDEEEEGKGEDDGKSAPQSGPNGVGENSDSEDEEEVGEPNEEDEDGEDDEEEGVGDDTDDDEDKEEEEEALQFVR